MSCPYEPLAEAFSKDAMVQFATWSEIYESELKQQSLSEKALNADRMRLHAEGEKKFEDEDSDLGQRISFPLSF